MKAMFWALMGSLALGLCGAATAFAQGGYGAPRQYYSDWHRPPQGNYAVRNYYCKPTPDYVGYQVHEVRQFPQKPGYNYYVNPKTGQYWGRCPIETHGKPAYSLLKPEDRKADLNQIPESAFPPPGKMPPIPGSDPKEGANLDLPPEDAPSFLVPPAPGAAPAR